MKTTVIVQARLGSTRLPRKALLPIEGIPMLARVLQRTIMSRLAEQVVLAIPKGDRELVTLAETYHVHCFQGNELDVLDRIYKTARVYNADPIIRITGDCPLIDPCEIDKTIGLYMESDKWDYVYNGLDGSDVEVFSFWSLSKAWRESNPREHVTDYIRDHFSCHYIHEDFSHCLSVDTKSDLDNVRAIYKELGNLVTFAQARKWRDNKYLYQVAPRRESGALK